MKTPIFGFITLSIISNIQNLLLDQTKLSPKSANKYLQYLSKDLRVPNTLEEKATTSCDVNYHQAQCLNFPKQSLPDLKQSSYKKDIQESLKAFKEKTNEEKKTILHNKNISMIEEKNFQSQITLMIDILEHMPFLNCTSDPNYQYCRTQTKFLIIKSAISILNANYHNAQSFEKIIHNEHWKSLPLLAIALFELSNNPDSFDESMLASLMKFNNLTMSNYNSIINIISHQQGGTEEAIKASKEDFTHILILSQLNLVNIFSYFEADNLISINQEAKDNQNTTLQNINDHFNTLLPYLIEYGVKELTSSPNFGLVIYSSKTTIEEQYSFIKGNQLITVKLNSNKEAKIKEGDSLLIFYRERFPFLSYFDEDYFRQTVSFRWVSMTELNGVRTYKSTDNFGIEMKPSIEYNMAKNRIPASFTEPYYYNTKTHQFTNTNSDLVITSDKNGNRESQVVIQKTGDYTFGKPQSSGILWLIVTLSVIGIGVLGGLFYGILYCFFKKEEEEDNPNGLLDANI